MNMRLPLALFAVFAATACVASGATLRDIDNELKRIDLLLHPGQQEKAEGGATAQDRYTMAYDVIEDDEEYEYEEDEDEDEDDLTSQLSLLNALSDSIDDEDGKEKGFGQDYYYDDDEDVEDYGGDQVDDLEQLLKMSM